MASTRGLTVSNLPTPSLVLDRAKLQANIDRVADQAVALGVPLRPHVKTPKSIEVARLLLARAASGITISTLREAEYFASHGLLDQLYATALAPQKAERAVALIRKGVRLCGVVDSQPGAVALAERTSASDVAIPMLVEINVDDYRSGVRFGSEEFEAIVATLRASPGLELRGLMTYAGASYHTPVAKRRALAERHRQALVGAAEALEARGVPCPVRSFGSTPAFMQAERMDGVTEVRGGIYVFQDLFQAGIGACGIDDIALSVATTVISQQPSLNRLFVDAGGLALSKDRSTAGHDFDASFGLVADEHGRVIDDVWVRTVHQELGEVTTRSGGPLDFTRFPVGKVLRILPNHADMTAAAYEFYHVIEGEATIGVWGRANGW
jgi:D-serine deaminase-like pyridoxal phosphate-dependent protein